MEKANQIDVSEYHFQDLKGVPTNGTTKTYEFQEIDTISPARAEKHEKVIRIEREHAAKTNFKIAPIVREHRGMIRQEESEREAHVRNEVNRRLLTLEEEAYKKGFEKGEVDGREEVYRETQAGTDEKLQNLSEMITQVLQVKAEMLKEERLQVYETIKTLTKWIILRELKDDGDYIERLLEKLILEMQTKANLQIHVNPKAFESMPEVLEQVEKRLGELTNVRVEVEHGSDLPGMVLQSENGILNGTMGVQFKNLDKLFSNIGLPFTDDPTIDLAIPVEVPVPIIEEAEQANNEEIEILEAKDIEEFETLKKEDSDNGESDE